MIAFFVMLLNSGIAAWNGYMYLEHGSALSLVACVISGACALFCFAMVVKQ